MPLISLVCIRASDPDRLARFYSSFGMQFVREKHGGGPEHYSCSMGGSVFEIYPSVPSEPETRATRLGFTVDSIERVIGGLPADACVINAPKNTRWGRRAVIQDPEGHKVELLEQ